jgi:hypothetical protein
MDSTASRLTASLIATIGWFALALQAVLLLDQADSLGQSRAELAIRFISYFTILTNTFCAAVMTSIATEARILRPLRTANARMAAAVYIAVVAIVYALILRALWNPAGPQWLADMLLHTALPAAVVLHWLSWGTANAQPWSRAVAWLAYPVLYTLAVMARGAWYPFFDPSQGIGRLALNTGVLLVLFVVTGLAFIAIGRMLAKGPEPTRPRQSGSRSAR